jgi:hypothetical protein
LRPWSNWTVSDGAGSSGPKPSNAASLYAPDAEPPLAATSLQPSADRTDVDDAALVVAVVTVVAAGGTVVEVTVTAVATVEDAVGAAVRQLATIRITTTAKTWLRFTLRSYGVATVVECPGGATNRSKSEGLVHVNPAVCAANTERSVSVRRPTDRL